MMMRIVKETVMKKKWILNSQQAAENLISDTFFLRINFFFRHTDSVFARASAS